MSYSPFPTPLGPSWIAASIAPLKQAAKARVLRGVAHATAQPHWRQAGDYAAQNVTTEGRAKALIAILQVWHGVDKDKADSVFYQ
jgi:hypothetical protein